MIKKKNLFIVNSLEKEEHKNFPDTKSGKSLNFHKYSSIEGEKYKLIPNYKIYLNAKKRN